MALTEEAKMRVQNLTYEEVYERIRTYYIDYISYWKTLDDHQKANHKSGNGRAPLVDFVNNSIEYIEALSASPTEETALELAEKVIKAELEYAYHDIDIHWIKMGTYASHLMDILKEIQDSGRLGFLMFIDCVKCNKRIGTIQYGNYYYCASENGVYLCTQCSDEVNKDCPSCHQKCIYHDGDAVGGWASEKNILF